jgi:hypothetical protein
MNFYNLATELQFVFFFFGIFNDFLLYITRIYSCVTRYIGLK